jgi:very-short-patch-repair endonuclease
MTNDIKKLLETAYSHEEIASILGYKYCNGRLWKILKKLCIENDIQFKNLGIRQKTRKYKQITKICPECNFEFITLENHPKEKITCSRNCSNIYFSKIRSISFTDKLEKECFICGNLTKYGKNFGSKRNILCESCKQNRENKRRYNRKYTKICKHCGKEFKTFKKPVFCSRHCASKYTMDALVKSGNHIGWKSRKKLVPSYPELYFMNVLKNMNVEYEYEKPVGKYFIDFEIHDKMIALEVDGKQHNEPNRILSDKNKDGFLKTLGYIVFRIKWYNPINDINKENLYIQIENFKNLLLSS